MGDKLRIDARLEDIGTGAIIVSEKVVGDDPLVLVDSLVAKISLSLNLGESGEAFKQYHLGMELFFTTEYEESIEKFQEALQYDSTFALPYMRIAMASIFLGRQAEATTYFQIAKQYEDRLPMRERNLLDVYTDLWLTQQFDNAFTKLSTMVRDYPEDPEIRNIYALLVYSFQRDSTVAFAHLDTVLATYPASTFTLQQYVTIHRGFGNYDKAIEYAERLIDIIPDVLAPQMDLAQLYRIQGRREEALELTKRLAEKFPDEAGPANELYTQSILARDFAAARSYNEILRRQKPDDPFNLVDYYQTQAGLANWEGKFKTSMGHRFTALEQARATGDSQYEYAMLANICVYYGRYDMGDSSIHFARLGHEVASPFAKLVLPLTLVSNDPANEAEARPMLESVMDEFKARLPRELWSIGDNIELMFEGSIKADTSMMIEGLAGLITSQGDEQSGNVADLGELYVRTGKYDKGMELSERLVSGRYESTSGWRYPYTNYILGMAHEGLGNTKKAIEYYREMLKYWGNPEIELKEIIDARERLARLTS